MPLRSAVVIGVVVLTYAPAPGMLEDCLTSLREPYGLPDDEPVVVVLVDNGGVVARGSSRVTDEVEVLVPPTNRGFAGGMNVGVHHLLGLGARAVLILNDDVVVEPGWLAPLVAELDDPTVGAVQPKLLFDTDPPTINSLGVQLGPDGAGTDIARHAPDDPDDRAPRDLSIFTGGAVLLRDRFVADTGGFDERFFLYYEDTDLSWRGRAQGWRYLYRPEAVIRHLHGASAGEGSAIFAHYVERNRLLVLTKNAPARLAASAAWRYLLSTASYARRDVWGPIRRGHRPNTVLAKRRLRSYLAFLRLLPAMLVERRRLLAHPKVATDEIVARWTVTR